jgi:DNA-directed RNA polymerase specialized sigma24 family protein
MLHATTRPNSFNSSTASNTNTSAWSAAQQHVADGLRENERSLQNALRAFIRSLGLATHRDGVESLLPDLFTTTFDTALQKADHYDPSCSLLAWLRQIAFNCTREHKRKTHRVVPIAETRQVAQHAEQGDLSEAEMFDLFQGIATPEAKLTLNDLLPQVPLAYHAVLRFHVNDGLKGRALATRMGTSEGAAATKLSRARDHLAKAYHAWQAG